MKDKIAQEFNEFEESEITINKLFHTTTKFWMKLEELVDWDYCEKNALQSDQCLAMLMLKRTVYIPGMFCEMNELDKKIHLAQIEMAFDTFMDTYPLGNGTGIWKHYGNSCDAIDIFENSMKPIKSRNFDNT